MHKMYCGISTHIKEHIDKREFYTKLVKKHVNFFISSCFTNRRESAVKRALFGSTYLSENQVPSSLCKKIIVVKKFNITLDC
jgi:hypothetical protein